MSDSRNALAENRRMASEEMHERVRAAIDELMRSGITPSFYAVADLAGVSRSTLYRRPDLRRMVEEAREQATRLHPSWRTALNQLEVENASLKQQVVQLQAALAKALARRQSLRFSTNKPRYEHAVCRFEAEGRAA
ncbi:DUF6262 family protein [uncultured Adlercreutzia sp.]|uniref:DUF6262 family protein n=1 Tax=uncultured Adlercreutzia sp. TaxID=875803 RepID=UPI0025CF90E6|nr:DUF6262 family protein [uncultured Adlercreutzia sp.]